MCQIFQCMHIPYFVYPFIHWWTLGLLPPFDYCEYSCYEHGCVSICSCLWFHFFWVCTSKWNCWRFLMFYSQKNHILQGRAIWLWHQIMSNADPIVLLSQIISGFLQWTHCLKFPPSSILNLRLFPPLPLEIIFCNMVSFLPFPNNSFEIARIPLLQK